jgi:hypothetical protein
MLMVVKLRKQTNNKFFSYFVTTYAGYDLKSWLHGDYEPKLEFTDDVSLIQWPHKVTL